MSYTYSIEPLISFCKKNKSKVMKFPKNKRVEEMYKLIDDNGLILSLLIEVTMRLKIQDMK